MKSNDIRMYAYSGYSILNKVTLYGMHKSKSYGEAMAKIKRIRDANKAHKNDQIVLIDYSKSRSRIVLINQPNDGDTDTTL